MTLDEKLDIFYHSSIENATEQCNSIIEEYKESLSNIYKEHETEAHRKADVTLRLESDNLVREKNRQLSAKAIDIRRELTEKAEELKEALFADVEAKLAEYTKTPDYIHTLAKQITEASKFSRGNAITIYINPSDGDKKEELEKLTGLELTISATNFIGGMRAVIHARNILIDNSFASRLAEQKDSFTLSL